jgi:hypothetical protein
MTISRVWLWDGLSYSVSCMWFVGAVLQSGTFFTEMLELPEELNDPP